MPVAETEYDQFAPAINGWQTDPVGFMRHALGIEDIHPPMIEIAEAVRDHKRVAVAGCHDSSKSYTLGALVWWWVSCFRPALVLTTSASGRQVSEGLWNAIRHHYENSLLPIGGDIAPRAPMWRKDNDSFVMGFSTTEDVGAAGATKFQGFKSDNRLIIMDEAVVLPRGVWESISVGLSGGPHTRIVAAANPTDPACEFARCWRADSPWHTINISAFDLPNLQAGEVLFDYLPTPEWVSDQRNEYGEDHPLYQSRVLGQFPTSAVNTLISMADFRTACDRPLGDITTERVSIGCDVALEGDDLTVIAVVKGPRPLRIVRLQNRRGDEVGDAIYDLIREFGISPKDAGYVAVDSSGGYGESPIRHLAREYGYQVRGENFGAAPVFNPDDPKLRKYRNRRTEMWVGMAEWVREEASFSNLTPQYVRWLEDDLPGCLVTFMADQRRDLERKADMKKRLGHSPDTGDALALALSWRTAIPRLKMPDLSPKPSLRPDHPDDDPSDIDHPRHTSYRERKFGPFPQDVSGPWR